MPEFGILSGNLLVFSTPKCKSFPPILREKIYFQLHQNIHQPKGLAKCLPFSVDQLDIVGRVLRASTTIQKGEFAILDKAFTLGKY